MTVAAMQNKRRMQAKIRPSGLAGAQDQTLGAPACPRSNRQHLDAAHITRQCGQQIGQTLGAVDHVQQAPGGQPLGSNFDPERQRRFLTQRRFAHRHRRRNRGITTPIRRVGKHMVKLPLPQRQGKGCNVRVHNVQSPLTVTVGQFGIAALALHSHQLQPRNPRAQTQDSRPDTAAQLQHPLP